MRAHVYKSVVIYKNTYMYIADEDNQLFKNRQTFK